MMTKCPLVGPDWVSKFDLESDDDDMTFVICGGKLAANACIANACRESREGSSKGSPNVFFFFWFMFSVISQGF